MADVKIIPGTPEWISNSSKTSSGSDLKKVKVTEEGKTKPIDVTL